MTDKPKKRSRHGLNAVLVRVKLRGLDGIDRRTAAARDLIAWRSKLIEELGPAVSTQKLALVDTCCRTKAMLDHVDAWLLSQRTIIDRRRKRCIGLVDERMRLADALTRQLMNLGLERHEESNSVLPEAWVTRVEPLPESDSEETAQ